MKKIRNQDLCQLTLKQKLEKLGQSKYVYDALLHTSAENRRNVEHFVDTLLTKGYMPA